MRFTYIAVTVGLGMVMTVALMTLPSTGQRTPPIGRHRALSEFSRLPIQFVENRSRFPEEVAYSVRGEDKVLSFTRSGVWIRLHSRDRDWVVKLGFRDVNPGVTLRGEEESGGVVSYFTGRPENWMTGLRSYGKLVYADLWPGIDLVFRGAVDQLKYEFVVRPGADPGRIRLVYRGATRISVTGAGALRVETPVLDFEDAPPVAYQEIEGRRVSVSMGYALRPETGDDEREYGFTLGDYDPTRTLVLDPAVLVYCGFIGGAFCDGGLGIAVDAQGCAYVTGYVLSDQQTFPVKVGPDLTHNGGTAPPPGADAFVAKLDPTGRRLLYLGYIGGNGEDVGTDIAVDAAGFAYVAGRTSSTETTFPVAVGPDLTHNGKQDAFLAKVHPQGSSLVYCGYIGGSASDEATGIDVTPAGLPFVAGSTQSNEATFPVVVGPDLTFNGGAYDGFVAAVRSDGTGLRYCGYIGGAIDEEIHGIAVTPAGEAVVAGRTNSTEYSFPVRVGPDLTFNGGLHDAFVAKVDSSGSMLRYCGYIGGQEPLKMLEQADGVVVDAAGYAYVTGTTCATEATFPVLKGPDVTHNGGPDAFIAKVDPTGSALVYCGYIGGSFGDYGVGVAVDRLGHAYVVGTTTSDETTFPTTGGPDLTYNGGVNGGDAFVAKVDLTGSHLEYASYVGGASNDWGHGIAVDAYGAAYLTGITDSGQTTFPVVSGPDLTYNGGTTTPGYSAGDSFVARVDPSARLTISGSPRLGATVVLSLCAEYDAGRPYQVASSLATGPVLIDVRKLNLGADPLFMISIHGIWPGVFVGYTGVLDTTGRGRALVRIPNRTGLVGIPVHTGFVAVEPSAPSGISTISEIRSFTIQM